MNEELSARIRANAESTDIGQLLRAEGMTTVSMDAEGRLVEHHPDGSTAIAEDD